MLVRQLHRVPPFTHLSQVAEALKGSDIALGAQDCATEAKGAYTGEIAASMIAALGCKYVILGHSERRQYYGETSATLNKKMAQAYANGLTPIYCVGENLEEREAGKHFDVVKAQIEEVVYNLTEEEYKNLVIAYEPVWAIGTGKTASAEQAQEIHAYIRQVLAAKFGAAAQDTAILYGGSCKPSNAPELFAKEDVDGGLIGGAAPQGRGFPWHRQRLREINRLRHTERIPGTLHVPGIFQTFLENHWPARSRKRDMKAESPDKGTLAQVYLLRPVLPHLRTRIPKVENIKMPVD